jgi:hypothetical protein
MLAAEHYLDALTDGSSLPKRKPLQIHRSKISLHHAKSGYDYPSIRLPHTFSKLAGLSTRIYQTVHEGALAFLVVVAPRSETSKISAKPPSLHGEGRAFESPRAHLFF